MAPNNVFDFPVSPRVPRHYGASYRTRERRPMRTLLFRSRALILKSTDEDLARDVCFEMEKAEKKLKALRDHRTSYAARTAKELKELAEIDVKLTAAVVAALLKLNAGLVIARPRDSHEGGEAEQ